MLEAADGAGAGAGARAGAWPEVAPLPNRLGAAMEEEDAVALVGLTRKEKSAFGAFEESAEGYK